MPPSEPGKRSGARKGRSGRVSASPTDQPFGREDPFFFDALGRAIRVARTQQDLTRKDLAERSGVSYAYLSDIETGRGRASSKALLAVAEALNKTPSELMREAEVYQAQEERKASTEGGIGRPLDDDFRHLGMVSSTSSFHTEATPSQPERRAGFRPRRTPEEAGEALEDRAELREAVENLPDDDIGVLLELARRLLRR